MELIKADAATTNNMGSLIESFLDEPVVVATDEESSSTTSNPSTLSLRTIDQYLQDAVDQTHNTHRRLPLSYWAIFLSLGVANSSDATEILCLSYILADDRFKQHFLSDEDSLGASGGAGNLAAAVFLGMLLGGLWVGTAGDVFGRRPVLLTGCFVNATAGILAAGSTTLVFLTFCRFVAGLGIGATVPPLFTLCTELAPPAQRGFWVAVVASFWMVGSIYVALVGFILFAGSHVWPLPAWRLFLLACALPSLLGGLWVAVQAPESPRFLALRGQHARAVQAATFLGSQLQATTPPWTLREAQAQFPSQIHSHHSSTAAPSSHWKTALVELYHSTKVLFGPALWSSMLGLQIVWASLSFGSYGLSTWINSLFEQVHLQNVYFNALLFALSNLPGNLFTAYYLDTLGRQSMLTGSLLAASGSLAIFAYIVASNQDGAIRDVLIVAAACSFQAFTIASWNTIDVLTAEVFPTSVRATAMGLCAATGRLAAMFAQVVNGALIAQPARLLITSAISLAVGAVAPRFLIPDRTGMAVLDTA